MLSRLPSIASRAQISSVAVLSRRSMSLGAGDPNAEVRYERPGASAFVLLNRPKQLNALNLDMVRDLTPKYLAWQENASIQNIVMQGFGEKAFCAGGDIKALYEGAISGQDPVTVSQFFREEYQLNHLIGTSSIPQVALYNGITMGGGVGLSVHGEFRVATENTVFAMPETAIGFFPDVGGSHFLSRLPRGLGMYLALTGDRLTGRDVQAAGIATHYVPSHRLGLVKQRMSEMLSRDPEVIATAIDAFAADVDGDAPLEALVPHITKHFHEKKSVDEIFESLKSEDTPFTQKSLKLLSKMSPLSMKVTFRQVQEGHGKSLADCLRMEFRISVRMMEDSDFSEGVRALLVDRCNQPKWKHTAVSEVSDDEVDRFFQPLAANDELTFLRE